MHSETFEYDCDGVPCEAYVAYEDAGPERRPCVLVAHIWDGQGEHEHDKARKLAALGYVGFALDMYGKGQRGEGSVERCAALMQPLLDDRALLRRRLLAALEAAKRHPRVDPQRIAAIGYCFGGLCVLDLARTGTSEVRGVVSFHGLLHAPGLGPQPKIESKILILHGYEDPMVPPDHVLAVARELTEADADWQLHAYGHALHAFSAPEANMPERGIVYHPASARRSWVAMQHFLAEALA